MILKSMSVYFCVTSSVSSESKLLDGGLMELAKAVFRSSCGILYIHLVFLFFVD